MARRLVTDAKIVLERAGYSVNEYKVPLTADQRYLHVDCEFANIGVERLPITGGTVDNDEVVKLLNARGCDAYGYRK